MVSYYSTRRSTRSAYAFAHEEGFGNLITSGRIMAKVSNREVLPAINRDFSRTKQSGKGDATKLTTAQTHQRQRKDLDMPNTVNSDSQWEFYILR